MRMSPPATPCSASRIICSTSCVIKRVCGSSEAVRDTAAGPLNFMAVLPDGEAHACRKFPSPIGNVVHSGIAEVYGSETARSYRNGCRACRSCVIRHVCGGCLAVAYSLRDRSFRREGPLLFHRSIVGIGSVPMPIMPAIDNVSPAWQDRGRRRKAGRYCRGVAASPFRTTITAD